ncbi:GntR family transcriptional regulator [Streptomyces eurocidicus]|uniref:GntR family transcriptional regulator n=2 Tax=Streptomyces eurocidicus TaxID=66423 RepID=A0A2N8NXR0_STREU|nr:PLP-dependent aminotransferase family protein [Streptomyces eurocidicus]MBF6056318.1 aminotransferase class I/II-fold pyridoxal phosphate-dependent enzyme [Streptomyces eurocidicus]PNE33546.1 GntR family transcriptional regulator [Streptomyces eurocidicus]
MKSKVNARVDPAGSLGSDLHLELPDSPAGGRRGALMSALRDAIRTGRLAPGTKLPPYRSLATDLGLARNTVAEAYAELVAEGWLTARQGSGTYVARRARLADQRQRRPTAPDRVPRARYNLVQGTPDASAFPRSAWLASARRALTAAPNDAFGPGDPRGRAELRRSVAEYLARARGVRADPDRIVICSGFAGALRLLGEVRTGTVAVESYGLGYYRHLLSAAGLRTVDLPVDAYGARVEDLADTGAETVLLTPAHQFPTGGPLHHERRSAVIDWARAEGGLVLEDDYDGEFRYDRQPIGAVQGLDPDRVVYIGSVSKSLSPALRLGWMVLPGGLVDEVVEAKGEREPWASALEQLTLADFLDSGSYDRHVRRMRRHYRRRRDQLIEVLAERAPHVRVTGIAAGLHAVLELPPGTEASVVKAAAWQGLALEGLSLYRHAAGAGAPSDGLVVGYGTPPEHSFSGALEALCEALPLPEGAPVPGRGMRVG